MKILVTGGAGFIGTHLVRALVGKNHNVCVFDSLVEQVHGSNGSEKFLFPEGVEFVLGDVRDSEAWRRCLEGCDIVYHLAAEVGVGQSMYEVTRYMSANTMGTAQMMELLVNEKHTVKKVIVASSMSIYGEGAYQCPNCGAVSPPLRTERQLADHIWELLCSHCDAQLRPIPTSEDKPLQPTSVYAISKRDQEELSLSVGRAYNIPTVALRFFNAYGPGQALSNPYTGVAAIFASRLLNKSAPVIFEDGQQTRDFVHVNDIVQGLLLALERDEANYEMFNLGSGIPRSISEIAHTLIETMGLSGLAPQVVQKYRAGDIRHCFADISKAQRLLGYMPETDFTDGMQELVEWVKQQTATDHVEQAKQELEARGLVK